MRVSRASAVSRHDHNKPSPGSGPRHALPKPRTRRPGPGSWLFVPDWLRPRSVRAKIVSLLMVPVVSLMSLWGFATVTTAHNVSDLARSKEVNRTLLAPVSDYIAAVQAERSAAARYLARPEPSRLENLEARAEETEAAAVDLQRSVNASSTETAALSPELPTRTNRLVGASDKLPYLRKRVIETKTGWQHAYTGYTATIDHGFAVGGALTGISAFGPGQGRNHGQEVASDARVVQELSRAREMLAREDAIIGSAQAADRMTATHHRMFIGAALSAQTLLESAVDDLRPSDEAAYRAVLDGKPYRHLRALERAIEDAGPGPADAATAGPVKWDRAVGPVLQELRRAETRASTAAAHQADPFASDVLGPSGIAVVLGLIGVLLSLLISVQIGRGLVVELVDMRNSALELAGRKLPQSLRRLHAGEEVDIEAEAPVQRRGEDEIGQVGSALNAVHRAALKAAAERAELLSGISGVYVKLARRSQVLLHRQLDLLDTMERRTEEPAELEDLFRLDHLTTRMRRHAESLIILSGAAPVRGWRKPVPMLDVVRAAVAEVEDFARVVVRVTEGVRLSGAAVADVTHLIAELVENAVVFSPPHTKVQVRGERVGVGLALEIEDRGLGMSQQALTQANRKIADASQVDLLDTDRLGLFVVNRLAHRRRIQVSLQASVYGGVTAVVLIPDGLLEKDAPADVVPADHLRADRQHNDASDTHDANGVNRAKEPRGLNDSHDLNDLKDLNDPSDAAEQAATVQELPAAAGRRRPGPLPAAVRGPSGDQARPVHLTRHPTAGPAHSAVTPARGRPWPRAAEDPAAPEAPAPAAPAAPEPAALAAPESAASAAPTMGSTRPTAPTASMRPTGPIQPTEPTDPRPTDPRPTERRRWPQPVPPQRHPTGEPAPLPQRVRQASLAPQLRDAPPHSPRIVPHIADPTTAGRSPERARATMAALRSGWLSGGGGDRHTEGDRQPSSVPVSRKTEVPSQGDGT